MAVVNSVIVFGPTGQTGLQILKHAILEGLEVTAFVRRPQMIPANISAKLCRVIQGNIFDKQRVEDTIEGHDAVISALGTGWNLGSTKVISTGCQNIISGMKKHNVKRLAVVSDVLVLPCYRWNPVNLIMWYTGIHKDHRRQLEVLEKDATTIDWIAVMPPRIVNNEKIHPGYKVSRDALPGSSFMLTSSVTTAEIGDFMVKVMIDPKKNERYRHCKVGISSHRKTASTFWKNIFILLLAILFGLVLYYNGLPAVLNEFLNHTMGKYSAEDGATNTTTEGPDIK